MGVKPLKDVQVTEEAVSPQKRISSKSKHEFLNFFNFFVGNFCSPGSGSGFRIRKNRSTDLIKYGSNPDPKHRFFPLSLTVGNKSRAHVNSRKIIFRQKIQVLKFCVYGTF
jgi:hypothetical protein